jgi:hypothetical protein
VVSGQWSVKPVRIFGLKPSSCRQVLIAFLLVTGH